LTSTTPRAALSRSLTSSPEAVPEYPSERYTHAMRKGCVYCSDSAQERGEEIQEEREWIVVKYNYIQIDSNTCTRDLPLSVKIHTHYLAVSNTNNSLPTSTHPHAHTL
jgi:hypothetical protein